MVPENPKQNKDCRIGERKEKDRERRKVVISTQKNNEGSSATGERRDIGHEQMLE